MNPDGSAKRLLGDRYAAGGGDWINWVGNGRELLSFGYSALTATDLTTRRTRTLLRAFGNDAPSVSEDGQTIAVVTGGVHPILVVLGLDGRVIQRATVPEGWRFYKASVYLP